MAVVKLQKLGLVDYQSTWTLQEQLLKKSVDIKMSNRKNSENVVPENHFLLCEHPHVYTLGKSGSTDNLLLDNKQLEEANATFYKINRGGDITYHGPGQLVGYPILDLEQFFTDIHKYLRFLEEVIILTLKDFGIAAGRYEGYTGVWLDANIPEKARKICAMGVRCSRWVTMHGFALNVNADLGYFKNIIPCGIDDKQVTSMHTELGENVNINAVSSVLTKHFENIFNTQLV